MGRMGCSNPSPSDPYRGLQGTGGGREDRPLETEPELSEGSFADRKKCTEGTDSPVETAGPTLDGMGHNPCQLMGFALPAFDRNSDYEAAGCCRQPREGRGLSKSRPG